MFTPAAQQPDNACLISNRPAHAYTGVIVQRQPHGAPGTFLCLFGNGQRFAFSTPLEFTSGHEHYLALSAERNVITIYLDGIPQSPITLDAPIGASQALLTVGDGSAGNRPFQGEIAEVKIHEQALSSEAVTNNMNNLRASGDHFASSVPR